MSRAPAPATHFSSLMFRAPLLVAASALWLPLPLAAQAVPTAAEGMPPELEGVQGGTADTVDSALDPAEAGVLTAAVEEEAGDPEAPIAKALVRVSATVQQRSFLQPWQRQAPQRRSGLGVALEGGDILTTAAGVDQASFIELQAASGGGRVPARLVALDPWLNLALLRPEQNAPFLDALRPVELADSLDLGDSLELWQLEPTGQFSKTEGDLVQGNVVPYPGGTGPDFLAGELRMVVQTRPNSLSAPFVVDGRLAGLLMGYDARQQNARMLPVDLIRAFLDDLADGAYAGRSSLSFDWLGTEDPTFREWLKLPADLGGIHLSKLKAEGGAEAVGLREGDVLVAVDGEPVDARGFVATEHWGRVNFTHRLLGQHAAGETVGLTLWREQQLIELEVTLPRLEPWQHLVPLRLDGRGPNYLILGGMMFQELTLPYLAELSGVNESVGLELQRVIEDPDAWRAAGHERVVVLCYSIPTPATFGYEPLSHLVVETAQGRPVRRLQDLADAAGAPAEDNRLELGLRGQPDRIWLDLTLVGQVNAVLVEQGLMPLQHLEAYGPARAPAAARTPSTQAP